MTSQLPRLDRPLPAFLLAVVGAVCALVAAGRPWVHVLLPDPVRGAVRVAVSGRQAVPLVPAVAVVSLAAGVALLLARTVGRRITGLLLVLAGAAGCASALALVRAPRAGIADVVAQATGTVGGGVQDVALDVTCWPGVAAGGAVLTVLSGVLTVLRARGWESARSRYEPAVVEPAVVEPAGRRAGSGPATDLAVSADPSLTWDAITRGEDPTREG